MAALPTPTSVFQSLIRQFFDQLDVALHQTAIELLHYHIPVYAYCMWVLIGTGRLVWKIHKFGRHCLTDLLVTKAKNIIFGHIWQIGLNAVAAALLLTATRQQHATPLVACMLEVSAIVFLLPIPLPELPALKRPDWSKYKRTAPPKVSLTKQSDVTK